MRIRPLIQTFQSQRTFEGAGFPVRRPFPWGNLSHIDPFLLIDEMGPVDYAPGEALGAPHHPHRGFETVGLMLEGGLDHTDSSGHKGTIGPGDVQWMTAGAGVFHGEMPSAELRKNGGRMHGFQIWVNLPAHLKWSKPRYQDVPAAQIPTATTDDGRVTARVIAGEALGKSAVIDTLTPITMIEWTLRPGGEVTLPVPADERFILWVFGGMVEVDGKPVQDGELGVLGQGEAVKLSTPASASTPARALLLGGRPIGEPVARYGPFVMNTREEILGAMDDLRSGRLTDPSLIRVGA